ncbi:hypothetical protein ANN_20249 [Periplaneta americana]|uniref:Uncharacterized protein n=1 Tax=Periplaneta americana TaxID=6978 RepID=A0ABQ8SCB7_PERAM|nr:hypothetical protein ANN_20249 [Periplaneta americana]
MDLREVGYDGRDWINLAQDREPMAGLCEGGNEPAATPRRVRRGRLKYSWRNGAAALHSSPALSTHGRGTRVRSAGTA